MKTLILAATLALAAIGSAIGIAVATHSENVDVRVAARSTDSGSIEFAIQQRLPDGSWSDYRFGSARFFTQRLHDGQWKHATPVQVDIPVTHTATPVATPTPTATAGPSVWTFLDLGTDPRTGEVKNAVYVTSTDHNWPFPYNDEAADLVLRCTGSTLDIYIIWGEQYLLGYSYPNDDSIGAEYHTGDYNLIEEDWGISTSNDATFVSDPQAFAGNLSEQTTLYVGVNDRNDGLLNVVFNVTGVDQAAAQLACWPQ